MKKSTLILSNILLATMFIGCGGGSDSGAVIPVYVTPISDFSDSTWSITESIDARGCDNGTFTEHYLMTVLSQSGNDINIKTNNGTYAGNISGDQVSLSGSNIKDGGSNVGTVILTIGSNCNKLSGNSTWIWSDGKDSCSGTSTISGTRNDATGC